MTEMYLEILELFFIVGGLAALILGIMLWFVPERVGRLSEGGNTWYSSRKRTKSLDVMRETDSFYFANNQVVGIVMFVVSLVALYMVIVRIPSAEEALTLLGGNTTALGLSLLLDVMRWVLIVFIVGGLPMWLMLAFAPERLKVINGKLNTWISTRLLMMPLETMNTGFDGFVLKHHRIFSAIFVLGSIFILYKFLR